MTPVCSARISGTAVACSLVLASCAFSIDMGKSEPRGDRASRIPSAKQKRAPIERHRGFVTTDDGARIYFERLGAGPALVLIHGLGGNHAVWYRQVPTLARSRTVITISQRGFAPSSTLGGDQYNVPRLVADLVSVLDELNIAQADIVGQSMGGWTALGVALAHPTRVRSVVLADTIAGVFDEEIRAHYERVKKRAADLGSTELPLGVHPALDPAFSRAQPDEAYLYQALTSFGAPPPATIAGQLGASEFSPAALAANQVPVLFLVGSNDRIFPPPFIKKAASHVGRATVTIIPGAGHSPYFETPGQWRAALQAFLHEPGA